MAHCAGLDKEVPKVSKLVSCFHIVETVKSTLLQLFLCHLSWSANVVGKELPSSRRHTREARSAGPSTFAFNVEITTSSLQMNQCLVIQMTNFWVKIQTERYTSLLHVCTSCAIWECLCVIYATITQRGSGSKRCWCCKLKYQPEEGLNMRYEDGGDALWMCTRCASKQKVNNNNKSDIATGTNAQLVKRLSQL